MTAPLCKCGCNRPVERRSYETDNQWRKREAKGLYRDKCAKSLPVPSARSERPRPPLELISHNVGRVETVAQEKEITPRDEAFRDFVRTFDCCECGWPAHLGEIEAHHIETGGTSLRCSDYLEVPLCSFKARGCHAKADKLPESAEKYRPIALMLQTLWVRAGHKIKGRK